MPFERLGLQILRLRSPRLLAQVHRTLARVYRELGADARAVRALEYASHLAGAGGEIWAELARAHVRCGELGKARRKLRDFDAEVQKALYKVAREARTIYTIGGHGEMNSPDPSDSPARITLGPTIAFQLIGAGMSRYRSGGSV